MTWNSFPNAGGPRTARILTLKAFLAGKYENMCIQYEDEALCKRRYDSLRAFRTAHQQQDVFDLYRRESCVYIRRQKKEAQRKAS